jgi:hypothetical protein
MFMAAGKIGVLVEVSCESDFVARTEDFQELIHDIAVHIAASAPKFIRKEHVSSEVYEREKEICRSQAGATGNLPKGSRRLSKAKSASFVRKSLSMSSHSSKIKRSRFHNSLLPRLASWVRRLRFGGSHVSKWETTTVPSLTIRIRDQKGAMKQVLPPTNPKLQKHKVVSLLPGWTQNRNDRSSSIPTSQVS